MSGWIGGEVWRYSQAEGSTMTVLLALADNADSETRECWPSLDTLAKKCRLSRSTVKRAVRELQTLNEVSIVALGNGRSSTRYRIHPAGIGEQREPVVKTWPEGEGVQSLHPPKEGSQSDPGVTTMNPQGSHNCDPQTVIEPSFTTTAARASEEALEPVPLMPVPLVSEEPSLDAVMEELGAIAEVRGAKHPSRRSVKVACSEFPAIDHLAAARKMRFYYIDGAGCDTSVKSIAQRWRNWLERERPPDPAEQKVTQDKGRMYLEELFGGRA